MLLDHQANITEGPGFNIFARFGDRVVTPDHGVLHGITRQTVLELAAGRWRGHCGPITSGRWNGRRGAVTSTIPDRRSDQLSLDSLS